MAMVPYFPTHRPMIPPQSRPDPAQRSEPLPARGPFGRDEADALGRMALMLCVIALFLFFVAMIGR